VGQRIRFPGPTGSAEAAAPWIDIVGMSGDVLESDLTLAAEPAVYAPYLANPMSRAGEASLSFGVAIKAAGDPESMLAALPRAIAEVNAGAAVYDVDHARSWIAHTFRDLEAMQRLVVAFAGAAIGLAAIGLFGVTSYAVAERSSEIGIRRALGASRRQIFGMILRETGVVLLIGGGAGLGLSWLGRGLLDALLYDVSAGDPLTLVSASLGAALVGLLAALAPAMAAARISPSRALADR
jgi:ABC-type antimicrobial peptide transport system permease subunit